MPGGGHRRRRGRSRRAIRFLEPTLLLLLHHVPAHGYTLLDELVEFGLGNIDPSAVYRVLRDMERKGWVSSTWDEEGAQGPPRRVYHLTAEGDRVLARSTEDLEESRRLVDYFLKAYYRHMEEGKGEHH
jgi:PadR family transcriptional regulator PadR